MKRLVAALVACLPAGVFAAATVLYQDATVRVTDTLPDVTDLWVSPADLTRVNGFVLKPEGACIDDICVPVKQDSDSNIYVTRSGKPWFSVTELARRLKQAYAVDHESGVWSFGPVPAQRAAFMQKGLAPDFTLPNRRGEPVSLASYDGMKILLLTWASW